MQVTRFLWDLLDSSNDSNWDDTDLTMENFVATMEAMPCSTSILGQDGTCNEPNRNPCNPSFDWVVPLGSSAGTRDDYNTRDIADIMFGDQTDEAFLNCVQNAPD